VAAANERPVEGPDRYGERRVLFENSRLLEDGRRRTEYGYSTVTACALRRVVLPRAFVRITSKVSSTLKQDKGPFPPWVDTGAQWCEGPRQGLAGESTQKNRVFVVQVKLQSWKQLDCG
jgi:hypothetical protein